MIDNSYDPFYIIKIDGKNISKDLTERILKFEFEDTDEKDNILTLTLDNNDLQLTDDPVLSEGGVITFKYGYLNRPTKFHTAKIKDVEGFKELKIVAYQSGTGGGVVAPTPPISITKSTPTIANAENKTYIVVKGDNLTKISNKFGLSNWQEIYNEPKNKKTIGANPNLIFPGQILNIPGKVTTPSIPAEEKEINQPTSVSNAEPINVLAQRSRVFEKMKYSDVATTVSAEIGLAIETQDSKIMYDSIPQSNEDNITFLKRLGKEIGFQCFIAGEKLHFHPTDYSTKAQRKLVYYIDGAGEVTDFYPRLKTQKVTSKVNTAATSPLDKSKQSGSSNEADSTKLGKYSYIINGITGKETRVTTPLKSGSNDKLSQSNIDAETEASGNTQMVESEKKWIEADIACIGIPEITSGGLIEIQGVGKKWSGNWYMKTITHTIDSSGYITKIDSTRNALGQPAKISDEVESSTNDKTSDSPISSNGKTKKTNMIIVDGITGEETRSDTPRNYTR